mmetsp:Transcript_86969/g.246584  ORF Transcript_86969/g.246584 Transcript_86969/m.246584 type:complete len:380 (-) Transcript_86969:63-1202(-)
MALSTFLLQQQAAVGADVYVFKLSCSPDGAAMAIATSEHAVGILDPATLQPVRGLQGHEDIVEDLSFFQADPACLASCSHDGSARIWDLRQPEACRQFRVGSQEVYSCSVGRGDTALACAASEKVHIFDIAQNKRLCVYKESHTDVVNHVRFHPVDTTKLLSGADDNLVVLLDTNEPREDEAMLGVVPNEECVRSFTLVGPERNTLCCASTTEDVRIWGLSNDDFGTKRAEFLGLRDHPLLTREESGGYVVETFYDQASSQVFLLAGAGNAGEMVLFNVSLAGATPAATFAAPPAAGEGGAAPAGHTGIVRSAICMPGGVVVTAGEDGCICAWREGALEAEPTAASVETGTSRFMFEPTAYGAARSVGSDSAAGRVAPY